MPLPDLIEIVPLERPVHAEITVPGSKSITNRALILAALANGETTLQGALWSEDTQVMADCLQKLGFRVEVRPDPAEFGNRTITVQGLGGKIPNAGTAGKPLELFVGNAGTAARFLTALVCLGHGVYRLHGAPRMRERPQAALFQALRELGYRIDSPNDKLPAFVQSAGPRPGMCWVSITQSSQFASALLLSAKAGGWEVEVAGKNEDESYVTMTSKLIDAFPRGGGVFPVEPDASSGSYFLAAGHSAFENMTEETAVDGQAHRGWTVRPTIRVAHWPDSGWQIDAAFRNVFGKVTFCSPYFEFEGEMFPEEHRNKREDICKKLQTEILSPKSRVREISRRTDLGDSIMTAIVTAPLAILPLRFTDLGRLRLQECERVVALRTELNKCGAKVIETGDMLEVFPSNLHGAEIETYNDHRVAMCFAILGLKVPGIKIKNPACVKKTFPNFFQKLATSPPSGLGTIILDATTRKRLSVEELFAE
jgi:3-phosphoshikimate 1-carboxyvinyltransferase